MKELEEENRRLRKMGVDERLKAEIVQEALKKVVRPSRRCEMAKRAVQEKGVSIKLACEAFQVSETCYRYQPKCRAENDVIADWLIRLTENRRNWGFGLCFLYLRNVKGHLWNHKRGLPDLQRICAEFTDQAKKAALQGKARSLERP